VRCGSPRPPGQGVRVRQNPPAPSRPPCPSIRIRGYEGSRFSSNVAWCEVCDLHQAGALWAEKVVTARIEDSLFEGNVGWIPVTVGILEGDVTVRRCEFLENGVEHRPAPHAGGCAGGLRVIDATVHIESNRFLRNEVGNESVAMDLIRCEGRVGENTLIGNRAGRAAAVRSYRSTLEIVNNIAEDGEWANQAETAGGGTITKQADLYGAPAFLDPDGGDCHLGVFSEAVDVGGDAGVHLDIDGGSRPVGNGFDVGAGEGTLRAPGGLRFDGRCIHRRGSGGDPHAPAARSTGLRRGLRRKRSHLHRRTAEGHQRAFENSDKLLMKHQACSSSANTRLLR